ncbi:uncharacterized protein LOC133662699 [Entelurus aequoreus]|uniref:uncharacterized protein LOC133662699 n=1 Tax=Entelurus aequoreus TaxID=161455 RepID=UPI002B1D47AF|nr:uncharacterized protein LOC133662699 [Entelurus aequoreus]
MGNLPLFSGLFAADSPKPDSRFSSRTISKGIIYFQSSPPTSDPLPASSPSHVQSQPSSSSRPLLLFLSWLGAHPAAASKYFHTYLERGMDVLLVQSSVLHFLWPCWGLDYGGEVLRVLEGPEFSGRPLLIYASSIGGYTFTQVLTHVAHRRGEHDALARRVVGHIYDSLVVGTLEHMATGLGKTLAPRLERVVKSTAMFYFWLFKSSTADVYLRAMQVFDSSPVTAPALFFFSEDDALCDTAALERTVARWRRRGVAVRSRKWVRSKHAAHMRCHPEEYRSTLESFLNSLPLTPIGALI